MMEALLEARMLEALPYALVKELARSVQARQIEKAPFARGGASIAALLEHHAAWLALQDIPEPTMRHTVGEWRRDGAPSRVKCPVPAKETHTLRRPPSGDDIFLMDEADTPKITADTGVQSALVWKAHGAPKVDMKTVMAEAASQRPSAARTAAYGGQPPRAGPSKTTFASGTPERPTNNLVPRASPKSGTSPAWRTTGHSTPTAESTVKDQSSAPTTPVAASKMKAKEVVRAPSMGLLSGTRPSTNAAPSSPSPAGPSLGPVITPTRQKPAESKGNGLGRSSMCVSFCIGVKLFINVRYPVAQKRGRSHSPSAHLRRHQWRHVECRSSRSSICSRNRSHR